MTRRALRFMPARTLRLCIMLTLMTAPRMQTPATQSDAKTPLSLQRDVTCRVMCGVGFEASSACSTCWLPCIQQFMKDRQLVRR